MLSDEKLAACLKPIENEFKSLSYAELAAMFHPSTATERFIERELSVDGETVGVSVLMHRWGLRERVSVEVFLFQERPWNRCAYFERFKSGRLRRFDHWYDSWIIAVIACAGFVISLVAVVKFLTRMFRTGA